MRKGTRDAGWALMVLITAMGRAGRESAGDHHDDHHDGYDGPFDDGYRSDDGDHFQHLASNGFNPVQDTGVHREF